MVDGVVEAPGGAHFTVVRPRLRARRGRSRSEYAASAKSPEAWAEFRAEWLDLAEAEYQAKVREAAA